MKSGVKIMHYVVLASLLVGLGACGGTVGEGGTNDGSSDKLNSDTATGGDTNEVDNQTNVDDDDAESDPPTTDTSGETNDDNPDEPIEQPTDEVDVVGTDEPSDSDDEPAADNLDDPRTIDYVTDADGWTELERAENAQVIYVSSSEGNDNNTGMSEANPLASVGAALDQYESGDWVLFKRGDTFRRYPAFVKAGPSANQPTLVSSYGDLADPRPIFPANNGDIHKGYIDLLRNVAWVSLHFYNKRHDPNSDIFDPDSDNAMVKYVLPAENVLFEDVLFEYGQLSLQGLEGEPLRNVRIRRSTFAFSWRASHDGHAQGIYANRVDGLLIEECVFDHNGHYPGFADPTKFNHNVYIQTDCNDVTFRNNITARASSHGFQLRPHGVAENNLSMGNSLAGYVSWNNDTPQAVQVLRRNVALHGVPRDFGGDSLQPPTGFEMFKGVDGGVFEDNILAHSDTARVAFNIPTDYEVSLDNNIVYEWGDFSDNGPFVAPERDIASYHEWIGGEPSLEAFMDEARRQRKGFWRPEYTAAAVNDYIRAGFASP